MASAAPVREALHFATYEVDLRAGELRKSGRRIKLQEQPFQILCLLLEHPGEVVTREELRQRLWAAETFVDFDVSLNTAVRKLRDALGDSPANPRFIETLPKRGYRFIYPLNGDTAATPPRRVLWPWIVGGSAVLIAALLVSIPSLRDRLLGHRIPGKTLRVAVLPLKNLSGEPEQEYFAAGMTEMLITELGRISALQVTSHQSVLGYAQSSQPLPQIAQELGVDAVLEGTVQRSGERVRVTVNFVQVQPENHLLAQSYDKKVHDIFQVQEDVARAIAGAIQVRLPGRAEPSSPARQIALEATDAYLRGTYLLAKGRDSDRDEARAYFQHAIEIDPSFARPYAALALMYAHGGAIRVGGSGENRKLSLQWAEKALRLDDSLAEAHAALASASASGFDFTAAEQQYKRAIELNPSLAVARVWYANFLSGQARYAEAFAQTAVALQLAPGSPNIVTHAVEPYLQGGRVDDAIAHWQAIVELQHDYWAAHNFLALGYMKKGMHREAIAEAEETIRLSERSPQHLSLLASVYARAGERDKALEVLQELEDKTAKTGKFEAARARAYAALGDNEKALMLLEEGYKKRHPGVTYLNTPQFDSLRSDPRFQDLVQRIFHPPEHAELPPSGR